MKTKLDKKTKKAIDKRLTREIQEEVLRRLINKVLDKSSYCNPSDFDEYHEEITSIINAEQNKDYFVKRIANKLDVLYSEKQESHPDLFIKISDFIQNQEMVKKLVAYNNPDILILDFENLDYDDKILTEIAHWIFSLHIKTSCKDIKPDVFSMLEGLHGLERLKEMKYEN